MLTVLLAVPFAAALSVAIFGLTRRVATIIALVGSVVTLGLASALYLSYRGAPLGQSFDVNAPWIAALHINYHLGIDGMSVLFVLLTAIITPVAVLVTAYTQRDRYQAYLALLIFLEFALIGVFVSLDLVLFYFFWEAVLIPVYFMIGVFGSERRVYAAFKYVIYTMVGSLLMLVAILALFAESGAHTFDALTLMQPHNLLSHDAQRPIFLAFALAFGIKSATFPFHSWVPDVYTESNISTTVILSGVVSKMGIYGYLRFCLPLFPAAARDYGSTIMILGVIGIIYGALLALHQRDMRRLVACSSIAHLGFITMGIFSLTTQGVQGATLQALNHGVTIAALFAIVAVVSERWGVTDLEQLGGLAARAPIIAAIFLLIILSALGLPGLNGFAGEFLILLGTFQVNAADSTIGTIGVILAAAYMLRLFQGVVHGPLGPVGASGPEPAPAGTVASWFSQMSVAQYAAIIPLLVLIVWVGVYPAGWLNPSLSFAQSVIKSLGGQP